MVNKLELFFKKYYLLIGLILVVFFILYASPTYAKYIVNNVQNQNHVGKSDCFKLTFSDGDNIALNNMFPISDKEASKLKPYTFTIKNVCNNTSLVHINLEELNKSTIDLSYIKYQLNEMNPIKLGSIETNENLVLNDSRSSRTIFTTELKSNEEKTFNLKMWIDESALSEQVENKIFASKVVVISSLIRDYVILNANGGILEDNKVLLGKNNTISNLPVPLKEDYEFLGWYDQIEGGNLVTTSTVLDVGSTIYAHYQENPYHLVYELDGGTLEKANPNSYNSKSNFILNNPIKEGYYFLGWSEEVTDLKWTSGWVDMYSGELSKKNSQYPNAMYSDLISVTKGKKYTVVNPLGYPNNSMRIRFYNLDGTYNRYAGYESFTPDKDGYIRVLFIDQSSEEQRQVTTVNSSGLNGSVSINQYTLGNRKYIANYHVMYIDEHAGVFVLGKAEQLPNHAAQDPGVYSKNEEVILDEYDSNLVVPKSFDLDFRCGNSVAIVDSICTFYVDGYSDGVWINLFSKSGKRGYRSITDTIFEGQEPYETTTAYSKYRIRFTSDDHQRYIYTSIKVNA